MNSDLFNAFLNGAISLGFLAIALFFLSAWRRNHIRLFGMFAIAFGLLGFERVVLVIVDPDNEFRPLIYLLRLAAFLVIIAGIVVQNRRQA